MNVRGNNPYILVRLHQAIEANALIVIGLDPNILDNMAGTGFAPIAHFELMVPEDSDVVT